jgi:hypothetical protein
MNVELDGFGDDVRVDGQQDDEGRPFVGEQHVDGIQNRQHLLPERRVSL